MTPNRHTTHPLTQAVFVALWAAVLITRIVPVDARIFNGNPVQIAPRAPNARTFQISPQLL
jgi:hypothetical protein